MPTSPARADASGPELASYYDRHMAVLGGVAFAWSGRGQPQRVRAGVQQVGVSEDACFALLDDGRLVRWTESPDSAATLMAGVASFACGQSGWFAVDRAQVLWQGGGTRPAPQRVADGVAACCIGDSADYFIRRDGTLWVHGLAHRGQYGDGRLTASPTFIQTASDAVAVKAHTGHAVYLNRKGVVLGTGGNRFGPLGTHGLGDKADRWGVVFDGAGVGVKALATGSRHTLALRQDQSLWAWGEGFGVAPRPLADQVLAVAAGNTATLALRASGRLLQWDGERGPREWHLG